MHRDNVIQGLAKARNITRVNLMKKNWIIYSLFLCALSCDLLAATVTDSDRAMDVELVTSEGTIIIRLSDKTPLHRDNFIKNVKEGYYDNIRYHRIIENFVIQVGNPEFKDPPLEGEPGLAKDEDNIPIELDDSLYHRRGALSAARFSDTVNPKRNSSSC